MKLLLEAFQLVSQRLPVELEIVGDGSLRGELQEFARRLGVDPFVNFLGFRQDPYKFIARSDLLVRSSNSEGLPSVLVEALHCGLPIVSRDSVAAHGRF